MQPKQRSRNAYCLRTVICTVLLCIIIFKLVAAPAFAIAGAALSSTTDGTVYLLSDTDSTESTAPSISHPAPEAAMTQMENNVMSIYRTLLKVFLLPLLILSYTWCGFSILFANLFSVLGAMRKIDAAKTQALYTTGFFIAFFILPLIMLSIKELVAGNAWRPPTYVCILPHFFRIWGCLHG